MNAVVKRSGHVDAAIRPFKIHVPDAELADLRRRIVAARLPESEAVPGLSRGLRLDTIRKLARYWATDYDWRKVEAKLTSYPQYITSVDGLDIHFLHVRSRHENALPLVVTHGWPGSIIEQLKIIEPLVDPTTHGGSAEDAFHVVIPSRPGNGFSGKPTTTGWDCTRIARAWGVLMNRLGYSRYVAQGGDWGALITEQMGALAPPGLLGIHTNLPSAVPAEVLGALASHVPPPGLDAEERRAFDRIDWFFTNGLSYACQMAGHPHALSGIADSPVGLATWLLDNELWDQQLVARAFDDEPESLTRDDLLDNITLYWLTDTAISAAGLYRENKLPFFAPMGVMTPVAVSVFPDETFQLPRSWAERAYPRLIHYNKARAGGHFAAWEQPKILTDELRAAFQRFRNPREC